MSIQQFELFHGAVLTKLVRSDRPISLRMIETRPGEAWAVYTINDEVEIFIKHSTAARELSREQDAIAWQFIFSPSQIGQIRNLRALRQVFVILVCGRQNMKDDMQIAFIAPSELERLIDFDSDDSQSLSVKYVPRKKLRIITGHKVELLVGQKALDSWDVPGS